MDKKAIPEPIYQSIIYGINHCQSWNDADLLAFLIKLTEIPENHDAIIKAWETKMNFLRISNQGVSEYILEQKKKIGDTMPGSFISLKYFKILKKDSKIIDRHGDDWVVVEANRPGSEKHPLHSFRCTLNDDIYFIFHDGKYLRYWLNENTGGYRICENFT